LNAKKNNLRSHEPVRPECRTGCGVSKGHHERTRVAKKNFVQSFERSLMIQSVGIDSVEIARFDCWKNYTRTSLLKIFSPAELTYSFSNVAKTSERLAARFAAKEAAFKALYSLCTKKTSLLSWCKLVEVVHAADNQPYLHVAWHVFDLRCIPSALHLSITHTKTTATALVIVEI